MIVTTFENLFLKYLNQNLLQTLESTSNHLLLLPILAVDFVPTSVYELLTYQYNISI